LSGKAEVSSKAGPFATERWVEAPLKALFILFFSLFATTVNAARIKDIGQFYGIRDNQITGAGLVIGLMRTGDSQRNVASVRSLANRLQGLGVNLQQDDIISRNVAMVMVAATLTPDTRTGSRIDVTVASTGDATSLMGGVLLMTPLLGTDGQVYAVAEGALTIGGFVAQAAGSSTVKNTTTVGRVVGGGLVEREVATTLDYNKMEFIEYVLRNPDFTTASRLADAINAKFEAEIAEPQSSSTVRFSVPEDYKGKFARFAAAIEIIDVKMDTQARVVINERTGTVVMGADVQISAVAVAHGGLTIEVRRASQVSQPAPLSGGTTTQVSNVRVSASEERGELVLVEGVNIGDLVAALNQMGVTPRDLITILQAIRTSGALYAEIITL
jgi:flagellar P-ring protein precursor FlgI